MTDQSVYLSMDLTMAKAEIKENRKEEIFGASVRCFDGKGYYKTTIDDIAAASAPQQGSLAERGGGRTHTEGVHG